MEKNALIGYKGWPLKDTIGAKRSNDNAGTLEVPKVIYAPIIRQPPRRKHRRN